MSVPAPSVPNTQAIPVFWRLSTANDPSNKSIQIQSDTSLIFVYRTMGGGPLGVSQAPTNVFSPYLANWTFAQIPYPTTITVQVLDSGSRKILGEDILPLFGGDVFKCRITYIPNTPAAHGWIDAMVNGNRQSIYGQEYMEEDFWQDDVWTRGSGN